MKRRLHAHYEERRPTPLADQTAGLELFEAVAKQALARSGVTEQESRDTVLEQHERSRSELLTKLRAAALDVWKREQRPVSANDVRHVLAAENYDGDRRLLGRLFLHADWTRVGTTQTACEGATVARVGQSRGAIGTYIPTAEAQLREQKAERRGAA